MAHHDYNTPCSSAAAVTAWHHWYEAGSAASSQVRAGETLKTHEDIKQKGIIFCTIEGRYWSHLVKKNTFVGTDEFLYTISNINTLMMMTGLSDC
jgi:hypothetical protein